jgi:hypothetical protein
MVKIKDQNPEGISKTQTAYDNVIRGTVEQRDFFWEEEELYT